MKKMVLLIWVYLFAISLSACINQNEQTQTSIPPIRTISITDTPSPTPTATSVPISERYKLVFLNMPPENSGIPLPEKAEDGGITFNGRGFLSPEDTHCFGLVYVYYSPTFEHLLLIVKCIGGEEQNRAFLRTTTKLGLVRNITGDEWGAMYGTEIGWSPDGKSFVYYRSACCMDIQAEVATGLVRYDIETGDRKLLVNIFPELRPAWSLDGKWIAVLDGYSCELDLISADGETIKSVDTPCKNGLRWRWHNLQWKPASVPGKMLLTLSGEWDGRMIEKRYLVDMVERGDK